MKTELYLADCLDIMPLIPDKSVQLILADLPYGTTACKWDSIIDLDLLWKQYKRIIKDNGAIVLTASQPFTTKLISSNYEMFKHEWIWEKNRGSNFASLKYQPMKEHESVIVFSKKTPLYKPIMQQRKGGGLARTKYGYSRTENSESEVMNFTPKHANHNGNNELRYPSSIQKFVCEVGSHPTQKPVALMEYLIKTYTNESETILDNTMGSGTTGVACVKTNRNFIGIEKDANYYEIAVKRIESEKMKLFP
jgi:site-specific DNA-methyltransferase (adenine-specific)